MLKYVGLGLAILLAAVAVFVFKKPIPEGFKLVTDKTAAAAFCAELLAGPIDKDAPVTIPVTVEEVEKPAEPVVDVPAPPAP